MSPVPSAPPPAAPTLTAPTLSGAPFAIFGVDQPGNLREPISCTGTIGPSDPVAIVSLPSPSEEEAPLSVVNFVGGTPREVCRLPEGGSPMQLLDATHAVIVAGEDPETFDETLALLELPALRAAWFQVPESGEDVNTSFVALSPNGDTLTWLHTDYGKHVETIHLATADDDAVVASFAIDDGGRCGSIEDSRIGAFSASGEHAFVLRQPIAQQATLTVFRGSKTVLSIEPPDGRWAEDRHPAMALWAPGSETLYYRKGRNVYRWEPGSDPIVFLDGVQWYDPTFSADGRWLAFATYRDDDTTDLYAVDVAAGSRKPVLLAEDAGEPMFLSSTVLWFRSADAGCVGPESEPKLFDIETGKTSATEIGGVFSTWPATSSR